MIVWLSLNVIKTRRTQKVSVGDGDNKELQIAMAAQSNAVEYFPIALIMLFALEINQAHLAWVHGFGIALVTGRIIHIKGMLSQILKIRVLGMQITLYTIIGLAVANLIYLPYTKLLNF